MDAQNLIEVPTILDRNEEPLRCKMSSSLCLSLLKLTCMPGC